MPQERLVLEFKQTRPGESFIVHLYAYPQQPGKKHRNSFFSFAPVILESDGDQRLLVTGGEKVRYHFEGNVLELTGAWQAGATRYHLTGRWKRLSGKQ